MPGWVPPHLIVGAAATILAFVPLFGVFGFEFAVAMGAVLAYVTGWRAASAAAAARGAPAAAPYAPTPAAFPGAALARILASNLSLLLLPIVVARINAWRVPTCNWSEGFAFYAVLGVPAVLYGTSLGFGLGLRWPAGRARAVFVLWSLGTYTYALWNVVGQPPKFAFNAFIGYFPGPIYDRAVELSDRLLVARAMVGLEAVFFLCVGVLGWNAGSWRLRAVWRDWTGSRAVCGVCALVVLVPWLIATAAADRLGLRIGRAYIQRTLGGHIETAHCHIYYATNAYTAAEAAELAREHEFHYAELREWFGLEPDRKIGSYVYASADQKKELMGAAGTNFEDALHDEFHINAAGFPHPVLRHEMAHIFAAQIDRWRPICLSMGIHEGIAVAAEWREESGHLGLTPHEACVAMDSLGVLPDVRRILSAFGFWTQASSRAYTTAGAFMHYLVQTHGMERFRRLWSTRDFASAYGQPLDSLLAAWKRDELDAIHLSGAQRRIAARIYTPGAIFSEPCAHEQARLRAAARNALRDQRAGDAESLYVRLMEIEPRAGLDLELARARLLAGNALAALAAVEKLIAGTCADDAPECAAAWRYHGDALWKLGRFAAAESSYVTARQHAGERGERRGHTVSLAALRDPVLRDGLRDYLTESNQSDAAALTQLAQLRALAPDAALPRYLLGRRLYFVGEFAAATSELEAYLAVAGPGSPAADTDVYIATLELLALSALRDGRPGAVDAILAPLGAAPLSPAERLYFEDVRARAAWEGSRSNPASDGTFSPTPRIEG